MADSYKYKKVLLLDDNNLDNFVNQKLIEMAKFAAEVVVFESGNEVLSYLKKEKADKLPDVIFLDIMMPIMDGFAFLDEFEKLPEPVLSKCKIVMLSTSESFKDLNRANKCKYVYKFLNKPLTENVLGAVNV